MTEPVGGHAPTCSGKIPFDDFGHAQKASQRGRKNGAKTMPYKCHHCGKWHLGERFAHGSIEKRVRQARRTHEGRTYE